ncbi:hypothetical protein HYPGJ_20537 [Hyphomicrobium sp. GJ21]|nr:hypothetical protein HYPGJ_20537 [Hyphomicrobium sp. GJ21]
MRIIPSKARSLLFNIDFQLLRLAQMSL